MITGWSRGHWFVLLHKECIERVTEIFKYILWVYEMIIRLHFPHQGRAEPRGGGPPSGRMSP